MSEREELLAVARAVAAGLPVDWTTVESSTTDESLRAAIRELKIVAEIAQLHHGSPGTSPSLSPSTEPGPRSEAQSPEPFGDAHSLEPIGQGLKSKAESPKPILDTWEIGRASCRERV